MAERIGLYGGTFDPVHHGHLILARDAIEHLSLDQLRFIPARVSPHRLHEPPRVDARHRVEMLRLAIASDARFVLDEYELQRQEPSFTIDTVEHIQAAHPQARLYLLLGADQLARFHTWHRFEELRSVITFVVFNRAVGAEDLLGAAYPTLGRRVDISSTELRKRVASGRSIRYLVPDAVADYIGHHQLYREESSSPSTQPR
ncbi:MAG: nicotinate (nicotinamide) nucleotide adenylyltransferase [Verrucomicrobia bacterium]|nr:nicotinate (nicotinamide) nucleotide adenylyltransferase [Verrucomicrobiota bacterium]